MNIIYVSQRKTYAAIIAAYARLGIKGSREDIKAEKIFENEGSIIFLGQDENLQKIYFLYSTKPRFILENIILGFSKIYSIDVDLIYL